MTLTIGVSDILMLASLAAVVSGFVVWMFKLWKEFSNLKTGMSYRQHDMVMIFKCLRVLLEVSLDRHDDEREPLTETLKELNEYIDKRAAGLNSRNKIM